MMQATLSPNTEPDLANYREGHAMVRKLRFLAGMSVSVLIFWYVGYWAARSNDPFAPISLLNVDQGVIAMAELLGLAVVAGGLAVAVCGARSSDRGALAIAVGLAALGLRGTQIDKLVLYRLGIGTPTAAVSPFPTAALIAETWLWLALIAVGFVVGRWVESWFDTGVAMPAVPVDRAPDVRHGLGGVAVVSLVAWAVISYAMGGAENPILKGQVYFAIGTGFLIGSMLANWLFEMHSRVWLLAAVAIVATAAYLFAGPDAQTLNAARDSGSYVILRPVVRALPIEYAAMGAVGALLERDVRALLRALFGLHPSDR